jgi:CubicO group peptidase (beta-lactamase class C family)
MGLLGPFEIAAFTDPTSLPALVFNCGGLINPGECDTRAAHAAEMPSAGGVSNARALAGMYAALANGGGGIIDESWIPRMAAVASSGTDAVLGLPTRFALGFVKSIDNRRVTAAPNNSVLIAEPAFGHVGMGGSMSFADPGPRLAFGYTMNQQGIGAGNSERCQALVDATYRSLDYTSNESGAWVK